MDEVKSIIKALRKQGFEVTAGTKHWIVTKDGVRVTTIASTPSDHRWRANTIAAARRHGFQWPPPR
jgi:hypothetical protein